MHGCYISSISIVISVKLLHDCSYERSWKHATGMGFHGLKRSNFSLRIVKLAPKPMLLWHGYLNFVYMLQILILKTLNILKQTFVHGKYLR